MIDLASLQGVDDRFTQWPSRNAWVQSSACSNSIARPATTSYPNLQTVFDLLCDFDDELPAESLFDDYP